MSIFYATISEIKPFESSRDIINNIKQSKSIKGIIKNIKTKKDNEFSIEIKKESSKIIEIKFTFILKGNEVELTIDSNGIFGRRTEGFFSSFPARKQSDINYLEMINKKITSEYIKQMMSENSINIEHISYEINDNNINYNGFIIKNKDTYFFISYDKKTLILLEKNNDIYIPKYIINNIIYT